MPTTAAKQSVPDMEHVWEGRRRSAREKRIVAGIAEAFLHNWTVDADGYVRDDKGVIKARFRTH